MFTTVTLAIGYYNRHIHSGDGDTTHKNTYKYILYSLKTKFISKVNLNVKFPIIAHAEMALSFALSFAVLLSAVLPVQSSYCASTCAVHVTQPILFFVANAPNDHVPGLSRKPMVDPRGMYYNGKEGRRKDPQLVHMT